MSLLKNTKYYLYVLLACSIIACSDDDKKEGGNGNGGNDDTGDYTESPLTPEQNKAKLETIGKDFVAKINASDHETTVSSLKDLADAFEDSNFEDFLPSYLQDDEEVAYPVNPYALLRVIEHNDANALMELATKSTDDEYRLSDFEGIYTYNETNHEWTKTKASNKVELQYTVKGISSVLTITCSGIKEYTHVDGVLVEVPAKTEMTLTVKGEKVMSFITDIDLADNLYSMNLKSTLTLNDNYVWSITADAKSESASTTFKMTVKDEELINGSAKITGNSLTNPDSIDRNGADILNTGEFDFSVMDIRLQGSGNIKAIVKGLDQITNEYPWDDEYSETKDKANAEKEMKLYNDNAKIEAFYTTEKQKFAQIKMGIYSEDYEKYMGWDENNDSKYEIRKDWKTQPILVFTSDDTELEFDTYFNKSGFSTLVNSVETLVNKYADMLDTGHVKL